jgi:hypothetical protein|tara:strand:- start:43 stop:843 length:801 start_codon:yes stop_codon:yes gene_type:complete
MSTLLYNSATDIKVERDYLANLQTPAPMGKRHAPYPFYAFATDAVDAIERAGFTIEQEDYAITKDEQRMFGLLNVSRPVVPDAPTLGVPALHRPKWNLLVALRGAHDQSISRGLAIGSQVMVCSNLCFHGDLGNWNSKQTTNIAYRIPDMVADAVVGLGDAGRKLTIDFDSFNAKQISRETGDKVLLDIYRSGGFSASQMGRAVDDWDDCSVEEHTANGRNLWWLFNSATHALKPTGAHANHSDVQHRSTIVYNKIANAPRELLAA